jgi:hypothetical protein
LPFDAAYRCLPSDVREAYLRLCEQDIAPFTVGKYAWLNEALYSCKRTLLFLIDELPLVYGKVCPNGVSIISELHVIGGLDGRSIHCILSGSGKYVRKLAFCKLDQALKPDYPNYSTVDLNSTRYVPFQILPFGRSAAEFKVAVRVICEKIRVDSSGFPDSQLATLFKRSGGCAGSLQTLVINADQQPYTTSAKGLAKLAEEKIQFLTNLYLALDIVNSSPLGEREEPSTVDVALDESLSHEPLSSSPNDAICACDAERSPPTELEELFWKLRPIRLDTLNTQGFFNDSMIYELCDDGFINYSTIGDIKQINFALPSLFEDLRATTIRVEALPSRSLSI